MKGFNFRRVGPIESGDAVGGQTMAIANIEYTSAIVFKNSLRQSSQNQGGHGDPHLAIIKRPKVLPDTKPDSTKKLVVGVIDQGIHPSVYRLYRHARY